MSGSRPRPTAAAASSLARRFGYASLVANVGIVVTGGAVRLTASGLGCPTWPKCSAGTDGRSGSFVTHGELGIHGVIEFSNRLLTFVLAAVAVATLVAVWRLRPARSSVRRIALLLALGIPTQALLGGITVLTSLNPWLVAGHLIVSMALISLSVLLIRRLDEGDDSPRPTMPAPARWLIRGTWAAVWVVVYLGTVVTGSGPHAGDVHVPRNGLDPAAMSQLHADVVFLLVGLTIGCLVAVRTLRAPRESVRIVEWLLGVELAQGLIGLVQYATGLPVALVAAHVLGAAVLVAVATAALLTTRDRGAVRPPAAASLAVGTEAVR